jgi:hypothetical protein
VTPIWDQSGAFVLYGAGITGAISALIAKGSLSSARKDAKAQRDHDSLEARIARKQDGKKDACIKAMVLLGATASWVSWKMSDLQSPGLLPAPQEPPGESAATIAAACSLFLSEGGYQLFVEFGVARDHLFRAIQAYEGTPVAVRNIGAVESAHAVYIDASRNANAAFRAEVEIDD